MKEFPKSHSHSPASAKEHEVQREEGGQMGRREHRAERREDMKEWGMKLCKPTSKMKIMRLPVFEQGINAKPGARHE
jgi:hypothetical protein